MFSFLMTDTDPGRAVALSAADDGTDTIVTALRVAGQIEGSLDASQKAAILADIETALSAIRTQVEV